MSLAICALQLRNQGFHPIVIRPNSKSPLEARWQTLVDRSADELRAAFETAPDGSGIGTVTHGFIAIDLDVSNGKDGIAALAQAESVHGELPATLTSITQSGGKHLFFRIPAGTVIKNSVSKIGPGIDVRGTGGQVVLPPTTIDGRAYRWDDASPEEMADLPAGWLALVGRGSEPGADEELGTSSAPAPGFARVQRGDDLAREAARRTAYMATLNEPSVQGQNGSAVLMRAAFHAKQMSRSLDQAVDALAGWNERMATPPWPQADLIRAIKNSQGVWGAGLDRPLQQGAPTGNGSGSPADGGNPQPHTAGLAWVESMQAYVAQDARTGVWNLGNPLNQNGAVGALTRRGIPAAQARTILKDWQLLNAARVDCEPNEPPTFTRDGELVLNNYVPPVIQPCEGDFPVIDEVLAYVTCGDPEAKRWLVNWMAFAYQNPARPMRTVPVLYGAQRTGKSLMARVMTALMGEQNCAAVRNQDLTGRFTSHFCTKLFVTVGEIEASEVKQAASTLKELTGEPMLTFEAKGSAAFQVQNRIKMLATSNQTLPVIVEGEGDTRWVLFKQTQSPDQAYTDRMLSLFDRSTNDWSARGRAELAALAFYLRSLTVDVDLAFRVYVNDARASAVEASRSSVEQFITSVKGSSLDAIWLAHVTDYERNAPHFDTMDIPGAPHLTGSSALYATYRAFCRGSGLQALGTGRFPGEVERYAPDWRRTKALASVAPTRPWVYLNVPRERGLRLQYLPPEMRQQKLSLGEVAQRPDDDPMKRAVANMQAAFGSMLEGG